MGLLINLRNALLRLRLVQVVVAMELANVFPDSLF